jgi:membrane protease YdiL (CAAX protease family)
MSENLSSKPARPLHRLKARLQRPQQKRVYSWPMLFVLPAWVSLAYVFGNALVYLLLIILNSFHVSIESLVRPAIVQTVIATLIYMLTIGIAIAGPYLLKRKATTSLDDLGLNRLLSWVDIGLAPLTFIFYTVAAGVILALVSSAIPGFPVDQTQDVGFKAFGSRADNLLAFGTLVILAPLAEETLFRGYLYGKLKKYVPTLVAALVTSLLFGIAHFQWNVGIDVFILSLFLCGLRSLTGSIWAGVLVHMIKNGIAYYLIFIAPIVGGG